MGNPIIGQEKPTPIYELFEKFPEVPRNIILKVDLLNLGLRFTPELTVLGKRTMAFGGLAGYESKPPELRTGEIGRSEGPMAYYDLPSYMILRDGTLIQVLLKEDSPYEIRYEADGVWMIYWNGLAVEEVLFPRRPDWMSKTLSDGTPMGEVLLAITDTSG